MYIVVYNYMYMYVFHACMLAGWTDSGKERDLQLTCASYRVSGGWTCEWFGAEVEPLVFKTQEILKIHFP